MSIEVWGLLSKAQDDDETIEEAIARLIAEHEEDPEAHLSATGSLNSHKASEIIDHLADSIIADKIARNQVDPSKLLLNKHFIQPALESLAGWEKSLTGLDAVFESEGVGYAKLFAGLTSGNTASVSFSTYSNNLSPERNPVISAFLLDSGNNHTKFIINVGSVQPFAYNTEVFGIRYLPSVGKVQGYFVHYVFDYEVETVDLQDGPPDGSIYRAEFDHATGIISFYINAVLIDTLDTSETDFEFSSSTLFNFSSQTESGGADSYGIIGNVLFFQDL